MSLCGGLCLSSSTLVLSVVSEILTVPYVWRHSTAGLVGMAERILSLSNVLHCQVLSLAIGHLLYTCYTWFYIT